MLADPRHQTARGALRQGSSRGWNQRANSVSAAPLDTANAARPTAKLGARTAMTATPPFQQASQGPLAATARQANTVNPTRTTCGSHALAAGQVKTPRPRRGQGGGGAGLPPTPPSTRKQRRSRFNL